MARPEKVQAVTEIKERIEGAQAVFLAEYAGLSVKEQQELRRGLRENGAEFKVVKMTLTRRAVSDLDIDSLDELLLGPTGLTFADEDPVTAAKTLRDFAKDHEVFIIKGGLLGREYLDPERILKLASIESREVVLAQLAGLMKAPMANLAGLLAALPGTAASLFQQLIEKRSTAEEASGDRGEADEEGPAPEADAADEPLPGAEATAAVESSAEESEAQGDDERPAGEASGEEQNSSEETEESADAAEEE